MKRLPSELSKCHGRGRGEGEYTPTYIVDYIVKNTVGKLLEGKTPKQASKLTILDPACGSGSFLLGAYDFLLKWHLDYYTANGPETFKKEVFQSTTGWKLTTAERKRILVNNIYGVDIDPQAVEVTKLSLLLKVLEGESQDSITSQLQFARERALPDLDRNIKCGNSLIGPDFYISQQGDLFDDEEKYRINVFDWNAGFPAIMKVGGFDAVIGNPPYGARFGMQEKEYLFKKVPVLMGQPESYEYFIANCLDKWVNRKSGYISFIVPNNFIESERAEKLRALLIENGHLVILANFRYNVWKSNASETLVFVYALDSTRDKSTLVTHPHSPAEFLNNTNATFVDSQLWLNSPGKRFISRSDTGLLAKINTDCVSLIAICDVGQGIIVYKTRADSMKNLYISSKDNGKEWKRLLDTDSTVFRYGLIWGKKYLKYGKWLWRPRESRFFEQPKIVFGRLRNKSLQRKLVGTFDIKRFYNRDNFNNIISKNADYSLKYVLGLFNSKLLNFWYKSHFDNVNINPAQVGLLPIKKIDSDTTPRHLRIVESISLSVDKMLVLMCDILKTKIPHEKSVLNAQLVATDSQIDQLVYELYGLTEEEIRIVEEIPAKA